MGTPDVIESKSRAYLLAIQPIRAGFITLNNMDKDRIKANVKEVINKYEKIVNSGQPKKYNEEETKKDFILPLFEALGWNVFDKNEVTAEEYQSSGRVDYGFYLDDRLRFYLEAKALNADLHRVDFANQAVRYSWNKGATWAVLTDFESIKVFNAQDIERSLADKLFFEIPYTQYLERFDQLWLLSKDSFKENLLDKEAEKYGKKLQKVSVTSLLYKDLDKCREILTDYLSKWNPKVNKDLLDEGVQKLLDRLIFLRVAEDRRIEPPTLIPLVREWELKGKKEHLYQSMVKKFREFDEVYNSNLFSEHPFEKWEEYSGATEKVFNILYGKKGYYEYDFQAMPADVLGGVYENYLGYRLNKSKKGLSVSKDAKKRKEHGIYYTPDFIVDYIVKNTLKPVLDKCMSVNDLKTIRVLDPACGSGSFLIKALEVIYAKYKEFGNPGGVYTKIDILLENIYGVDLDPQAVEIARLNLLISALDTRMKLPGLDKNIRNGNSLISGTDEELKKHFGKNFKDKNPFNWKEQFPDVFKQGGFDVVIGNPPYIFARGGNFEEVEKNYYYKNYKLQKYQINTYLLFVERAYSLLKKGGHFGFIIPNNWLTINSFSGLREFLLRNTGELRVINAIDTIFSQASVDTCILLFNKDIPTLVELGELKDGQITFSVKHKPEDFYTNNFIIKIAPTKTHPFVAQIAERCVPLGKISDVKSGLVAYEVGKGEPAQTKEMKDQRVYHGKNPKDNTWIKYVDGVDVGRYSLSWSGAFIKYGKNLSAPRDIKIFSAPRILVRQIPSKPPHCINAVYVKEVLINDRNSNNILEPDKNFDIKYLLGIINSRLISYWFVQTFDKFQRKIFPQFKVNELAQFPIYPASKDQQRVIVSLVDKILRLNVELNNTSKDSDQWNSIKAELERIDQKIDAEVYKLYGFTLEEIKIVEENND